jgi:hypothetical protein
MHQTADSGKGCRALSWTMPMLKLRVCTQLDTATAVVPLRIRASQGLYGNVMLAGCTSPCAVSMTDCHPGVAGLTATAEAHVLASTHMQDRMSNHSLLLELPAAQQHRQTMHSHLVLHYC